MSYGIEGVTSERATRLNDVPEGAGVRGGKQSQNRRKWLRNVGTPRTPYIRTYTAVAVGRKNIEELGLAEEDST